MKPTDKRYVMKVMTEIQHHLLAEMRGHGDGLYARGMSSEGFSGGYMQALQDIDGALSHGMPSDHRGYWKAGVARLRARTDPTTDGVSTAKGAQE